MTRPAHIRPIAGGQQRASQMLADELLAKLVGRGSNHAFAVLCERHSPALHRYCLSILRDDYDAQDALQSTMTRAYAALRARERDVRLRAWLFRIAHNESVTILRKRAWHAGESQASAHGGDPHAVLEQRARLSQLVADLRALPQRQRATLVMRELNGLGIGEIAQALNISTGVAKQSLFEARNSLRDFDRGRAMECEVVRSAISAQDRRVLRGRRISAHLSSCESCRGYRSSIGVREADLRALVPALPAPAVGAALARALGIARWGARRGVIGAPNGSSQELLTHTGASALIKLGASVAVIAASAAGAAHFTRKSAPPRTSSDSTVIATEPPSPSAADRDSATAERRDPSKVTSRPPPRRASHANRGGVVIRTRRAAPRRSPWPASRPPTANAHPIPASPLTKPKPTQQSSDSQVATVENGPDEPTTEHGKESPSQNRHERASPTDDQEQDDYAQGEDEQSSPGPRPGGPDSGGKDEQGQQDRERGDGGNGKHSQQSDE